MKEIIEQRLEYHKNELKEYKSYRSKLQGNDEIIENEKNIKDLNIRIDELNILLKLTS